MKLNPFEPLIDNITGIVNFTDDQLDTVKKAFKLKVLGKKEYLLRPGSVSNHLYFVSSGCLRVYSLEDTREIITQFGIKGWCVNDLSSYLTKKPATQFIQAVEPSVVLQIHRDSLETLYDEVPPIERFFRIKFQNAQTVLQQRQLNSISQTALERYEQFRTQYRDIEQRVPQYMVASYLGITKEFLSFLRKNH
jgi:CRP/FNR family transcriptional regulator, anaerobic regulatory protein